MQSSHGLVTLAILIGIPQCENAIISKPLIFLIFLFILFLCYESPPTKCRNPQAVFIVKEHHYYRNIYFIF